MREGLSECNTAVCRVSMARAPSLKFISKPLETKERDPLFTIDFFSFNVKGFVDI